MDILIAIALMINSAATISSILSSKKDIERLTLKNDDLQYKINELKEKIEELEKEIL